MRVSREKLLFAVLVAFYLLIWRLYLVYYWDSSDITWLTGVNFLAAVLYSRRVSKLWESKTSLLGCLISILIKMVEILLISVAVISFGIVIAAPYGIQWMGKISGFSEVLKVCEWLVILMLTPLRLLVDVLGKVGVDLFSGAGVVGMLSVAVFPAFLFMGMAKLSKGIVKKLFSYTSSFLLGFTGVVLLARVFWSLESVFVRKPLPTFLSEDLSFVTLFVWVSLGPILLFLILYYLKGAWESRYLKG